MRRFLFSLVFTLLPLVSSHAQVTSAEVSKGKSECDSYGTVNYDKFDETVSSLQATFMSNDFVKLDSVLNCLLNANNRFSSGKNGAAAVYWFYRTVLPGRSVPKEVAARVREWKKQQAQSIFSEFAVARMMYANSWGARGQSPSSGVSKSAFKAFNDGLISTERSLMGAQPFLRNTPIWQNLLMATVMDSQESKLSIAKIFEEGVTRWPTYFDFYEVALTRLVPAWGGSWEAVDAFIKYWANHFQSTEQNTIYARFYTSIVLEGHSPGNTKLEWARMKASLDELIQRYPDPRIKNTAASFACFYRDKPYHQKWISQIPPAEIIRSAWISGVTPENCMQPVGFIQPLGQSR